MTISTFYSGRNPKRFLVDVSRDKDASVAPLFISSGNRAYAKVTTPLPRDGEQIFRCTDSSYSPTKNSSSTLRFRANPAAYQELHCEMNIAICMRWFIGTVKSCPYNNATIHRGLIGTTIFQVFCGERITSGRSIGCTL